MSPNESGEFRGEKTPTKLQAAENIIMEANKKNLSEMERHVLTRYIGMFLLEREIFYGALYSQSAEKPPHKLTFTDDGNDELDQAINSLEKQGLIKMIAE